MTPREAAARRPYHGAPLLDPDPFVAWLGQFVPRPHAGLEALPAQQTGCGIGEWSPIAKALGVSDRAIYRWRYEGARVQERTVERAGLMFAGNPRLAAELYPHLAEPVCGLCRSEACAHLGDELADDAAYWTEQFAVAS